MQSSLSLWSGFRSDRSSRLREWVGVFSTGWNYFLKALKDQGLDALTLKTSRANPITITTGIFEQISFGSLQAKKARLTGTVSSYGRN